MILLDYPRLDHMVHNEINYGQSRAGKEFKRDLSPLGLKEKVNYVFDYIYPKVPEPDKLSRKGDRVLTYKEPKMAEVKENLGPLIQHIDAYKPDLLIPVNSIGAQLLTGSKITKAQGVPVKGTLGSFSGWVLPMFSQEYVDSKPINKITRDLSISMLQDYLEKGEQVFTPERPDYHEVTTMDEVRRVFAMPKTTGEFAWDTETNTLFPNRLGAKILVLSFSWAEGHAVAIPLEHGERYNASGTTMTGDKSIWTPADLHEIYDLLRNLMEAKTVGEIKSSVQLNNELPPDTPLIKCGHNISFDEHFMMATGHIDTFNNVLDTLVGYYLEIRQDTEASRHLSDLAFQFTTIGGYDYPLEEYKKWLMQDVFRSVAKYLSGKRKEDKDYQLSADDDLGSIIDWSYLDKYHFDNQNRIKGWVISKIVIPVANRYSVTSISAISKIKATMDVETVGTDDHFNDDHMSYEWIPMEIMAYYAAGDSDAALRLHHQFSKMIDRDSRNSDGRIKNLYYNFYPQLSVALSKIQNNGMHVDDDYLTAITKVYKDQVAKLDEQIRSFPQVKDIEDQRLALYQQGVQEFAKPVKERDKDIVKWRNKYKDDAWKFSASRKEDKNYLFFHELGYHLPYDKLFIVDSVFKSHKPEAKLTYKDYKSGKDSIDEIKKMAEKNGDKATAKLMDAFREYSLVAKISSSFTESLREYISDKDGCIHGRYNLAGTECVSGDTKVLTSNGWVRIDSLSNIRKEKVFTPLNVDVFNKDNKQVKGNFYYTGIRDGLKITFSDGSTITTTSNHPLLKNMEITRWKHSNIHLDKFSRQMNSFDWAQADTLKVGDAVKFEVGQERYGTGTSLVFNSDKYLTKVTNKLLPTLPSTLTPDLAEWLGMYTADGSYSKNNGSFGISLTNHYEPVQKRFYELTNRLFGINARFMNNKNRVNSVAVSSKALGDWLVDMFDIKSRAIEKHIPSLVMSAPKSIQQAFLKGWSLDSSTRKREYPHLVLSTISESLAQDAKLMLNNMGIVSRLTIDKAYEGNGSIKRVNPTYNIYLTFENAQKFIDEIGLEEDFKLEYFNEYKTSWNKSRKPRTQGLLTLGDIHLVFVESVEPASEQPFYDLNIPDGSSFFSNSVVSHNTSRLSSSQINMQNIPAHTSNVHLFNYNYPIKRMFNSRFEHGHMLNIDYSSLEFHILALVTQEESMTQAFLEGKDIHKANASLMYDVPYDEVTAEQRQDAKALGFGSC